MTDERITNFDLFFAHVRETSMWHDMVNTHEGSPWHREANVAVHTQMLLAWYVENMYEHRSEKQRIYSMIACLFHDVGKPPAEIEKYSEARGNYRAYHGHEALSARMWVSYATGPAFTMLRDLFNFTIVDIADIALMIEYHVPFDIKDERKKKALKNTLLNRLGPDGHRAWLDFLLSDQHGRLSDDQDAKLKRVSDWMDAWELV
jgi:hypothetical protein